MIIFQKKTRKKIIQKCWKTPNHPYRILIIGGCGSGKTNALFDLIKKQDDDVYKIADKLIDMLKINMKQNMNILSKNVKIMVLKI